MAVRPDYQKDPQQAQIKQMHSLLTGGALKGTGVEDAFAHIGQTMQGGKPVDPEVMARSIAEAKRMLNGGIPRDQLEKVKENVQAKLKEYFGAGQNSRVYELPPHLLDAKDYLAGQVQSNEARTEIFSGDNLGMTVDDIQAQREQNTAAQMAMYVDLMTADLAEEDAAEVIDAAGSAMESDEGSYAGTTGRVPGTRDMNPQYAPNQATPDMLPTATQPQEMQIAQGPLSAVVPKLNGEDDDELADSLMEGLTSKDLRDINKEIDTLLNSPPERQIAKLQEPNPLVWVGIALLAITHPHLRPGLIALPFQAALGEMERQQALFDKAYAVGDAKWRTKLDILRNKANLISDELSRETTRRGQNLTNLRELSKFHADQRADVQKAIDGHYDDLDNYVEKGGTREQVLRAVQEINKYSPMGEDKKPQLLITPQEAQAYIEAATSKYDRKARGEEALIGGREARTERAWYELEVAKRVDPLKIALLEENVDARGLENDLLRFKVLNAPQDQAIKWAKDIASLKQITANVQNMIADNNRADAQLELSKMKTLADNANKMIGIIEERNRGLGSRLRDIEQRIALSTNATDKANLEKEKAQVLGEIASNNEAIGKQTTVATAPSREEQRGTGLYGFIEEINKQASNLEDKFGGIDRPDIKVPGVKVEVPSGYGKAGEIKEPKSGGKYVLENGGKFDLGQTYKYGAKGSDGKTDCSGFVCQTMGSIGTEDLKNFPSGTWNQTNFIETKLQSGDNKWGRPFDDYSKSVTTWNNAVSQYNDWAKQFQAADPGKQIFMLEKEPPKPGNPPSIHKFLKNGDLIYFNVPKTKPEDSGRHVGIFIGLDKNGNALIAEAYSAQVPNAEQVRIASYNLDELIPQTQDQIDRADSKFIVGAYRYYPKGKVK